MRSPIPDYLQEILVKCDAGGRGAVADYIPELSQVDLERRALALCTMDGRLYTAGDADTRFTIQSLSKPFVYALALRDHGLDAVLEKVAVEPSGDAFNEISVDEATGRPLNPMINIGAITTHALVGDPDLSNEERDARISDGLAEFAGRELDRDEPVYSSEIRHAYRNRALANLARSRGAFANDPLDVMRGYTRQCSYRVDARDLAVMATTLANEGVNPLTGEKVVSGWVCRHVLSVMATCGMYDGAGEWMSRVGMPAKSGVSGGILGTLPGQVGVGAFSPRLDHKGNSVEGVRFFEQLSRGMGLHLMELPPVGVDVLRTRRDAWIDVHYSGRRDDALGLQGPITFASAERVLRRFEEVDDGEQEIVLDFSNVTSVNHAGRRMLLEGMRRLVDTGHRVGVVDPHDFLPEPDLGDGRRPFSPDDR